MSPTYGYQIFTGARKPSRDKVLQLAFAMSLSVGEAQQALMLAGANSLSSGVRRDAIVLWYLDRGASLQRVNEGLWSRGERTVC